ncbi:MAG TPA: HAD family phosphatase [Streptosporangiaceae bacterium]|nr:HAD family phosphatase [Streptosporangiaceae bacterium]
MRESGITAVVFDIGGVLLDWDPRHLYRKLIDDPVRLADFLDRICTPQWHLAHDLGADIGESCRVLASQHPEHADLIMAWAERGEEMVTGAHDEVVEILAELCSAGVRCFALSNMEEENFALRRSKYSFFELFEGCVISGIEGVAKPDHAIFEILLSRYGLEPRQAVFIDDVTRNVNAAAQVGLVALRYTSAAQLRQDLGLQGLPASTRTADGQAAHAANAGRLAAGIWQP